MRYFILPLGCQMNQSDTERICSVLHSLGYVRTDNEEEANILGIVACSVRQKAIDKVYSRIHKWNLWKSTRPVLTFISGCILPVDREAFLTKFDLLFTINELPLLPDMLRQYGIVMPHTMNMYTQVSDETVSMPTGPHGVPYDIRDGFWNIHARYSSPFEAYVPIQNGCDKFCTFCAVPYTRGREVSRPSTDILQEIETLVDRKYKRITLLGQNVNSYGLDKRSTEMSFEMLLRSIGEITKNKAVWIYFTSPHPHDMTTDVLETIAEFSTLAKHIHLPLQSGDDKVLIRMNRNYRVSKYRGIVQTIRELLPTATLFTDIIVGFTGETAEQFQNTEAAMQEFCYNMAYIAMYSPRPGAASSRWADDVPQAEKKRRLHILSATLQQTSGMYNQALIGKTMQVLVDGRDRKGYLSAKTEGGIPVRIDDKNADDSIIGNFAAVHITNAMPLSIKGELIPASAMKQLVNHDTFL